MQTTFSAICVAFYSAVLLSAQDLPTIEKIIIHGNKTVPESAILHKLPYKRGMAFDASKSDQAIHLLDGMDNFKRITLEKEALPNNEIELHVIVEEKKTIESIVFDGNNAFRDEKIKEEIGADQIKGIDEDSAKRLALAIKKMYQKENYFQCTVTPAILPDAEFEHKATIMFTIDEGIKSRLRKIRFKGNTVFDGRTLRSIIPSGESWILSMLSSSGKYDPDMVEADKMYIASYYRNHGYLEARVTKSDVVFSEDNSIIDITHTVSEGPIYTVSRIDVDTDKDNEIPHQVLSRLLELSAGDVYSEEKVRSTIEKLKALWGDLGYIDATIIPQIVPDEEMHTVSLHFSIEKGTRWRLNRINITGNEVTQDKVIRRQIILEEGDIITTHKLDASKNNIEYLSYFDQKDGVTWKKHRIDDGLLNLELKVTEVPSRNISGGITFGPSKNSPGGGFRYFGNFDIKNIYGMGIDTLFNVELTTATSKKNIIVTQDSESNSDETLEASTVRSPAATESENTNKKSESQFPIDLHKITFGIHDPYLFDTNISGGFSVDYQKDHYKEWQHYSQDMVEKVTSASAHVGFPLPTIDRRTSMNIQVGIQDIANNNTIDETGKRKIQPVGVPHTEIAFRQKLINNKFLPGTLQWIGIDIVKDTRNHRVYPNDGYQIALRNKLALPGINSTFSFIKSELNMSWYTPLIGVNDLVLGLKANGSIIRRLGLGNERIPYRELFHKGGQDSIRGFRWGEAGPSWNGTPMGGTNAVQFNAELVFPLVNAGQMKAHIFYDAGCAWGTPMDDIPAINHSEIIKNNFNIRHTIGVGINILRPQPMKISFGYKLDRSKKLNETPHEFHIGANMAF